MTKMLSYTEFSILLNKYEDKMLTKIFFEYRN